VRDPPLGGQVLGTSSGGQGSAPAAVAGGLTYRGNRPVNVAVFEDAPAARPRGYDLDDAENAPGEKVEGVMA
jgi:hypothetical protein